MGTVKIYEVTKGGRCHFEVITNGYELSEVFIFGEGWSVNIPREEALERAKAFAKKLQLSETRTEIEFLT